MSGRGSGVFLCAAAGIVLAMSVTWVLRTGIAAAQQQPGTSCEICHSSADLFEGERVEIVAKFQGDVHAEFGLGCHSCHGGNSDPALSEDMEAAMDPGFKPNPYVGVPEETAIPEFCGNCHSSLEFMRRFRPDARVDQVEEYWTSQHGRSLRNGDTKVATCEDCHGTHEILRVGNPESTVYPTNVSGTCGRCHADAEYMRGYTGDHGQPLPVDQRARWERSVHAAAMREKGDLSAPTCNDCHGNHGAAPPGVESIAFVCGQCHGRESGLFRASAKQDAFAMHNELLEDDGTCGACHEAMPEHITANVRRFSECATCHENHAVIRPTAAFLGSLPETPCVFCHEASTIVSEPKKVREHFMEVRDDLIKEADAAGLEGADRFNWLVEEGLKLPAHTFLKEGEERPILRPEFQRLFEKFRIGKTTYSYENPVTGEEVVVPVRQCADCHRDADSAGLRTANRQLEAMNRLTGMIASAERILLAAHRGGVETRKSQEAIDAAVDKQIELEVLVHAFDAEGEFAKKYEEGILHASAALEAGSESLNELSYRRRGLFAALAFIVLLLAALAFKIRQIAPGSPRGVG